MKRNAGDRNNIGNIINTKTRKKETNHTYQTVFDWETLQHFINSVSVYACIMKEQRKKEEKKKPIHINGFSMQKKEDRKEIGK